MAPNKNSLDPRRAWIDQEGSHSHRERIAHKNSNRRTPSEKFAREPVVANSDISQWNSEILFCSIFGMRKENCRKTCGEGSETGWKLAACFVRILRMGSYINWRRWPTICGATAAIFACTRRVCCRGEFIDSGGGLIYGAQAESSSRGSVLRIQFNYDWVWVGRLPSADDPPSITQLPLELLRRALWAIQAAGTLPFNLKHGTFYRFTSRVRNLPRGCNHFNMQSKSQISPQAIRYRRID